MTQYPPPPPPFPPAQGPLGFGPYPPPRLPRGAARRAGILMSVLAVLMLLCGVALLVFSLQADWAGLQARTEQIYGPEVAQQMKAQGATPQQLKVSAVTWGAIVLAVGIVFLILGVLVFRGSSGAIITAIVVDGIVMLGTLCLALVGIVLGARMGAAGAVAGCVGTLPLLICGVLMVFLVLAIRGSSRRPNLQWQQRAQWQQYAAQTPDFGSGGYGYRVSLSPPPASSSPVALPPPPPDLPDSSQPPDSHH